jgi:CubicO group peptidase (beta-lactamase class C family)
MKVPSAVLLSGSTLLALGLTACAGRTQLPVSTSTSTAVSDVGDPGRAVSEPAVGWRTAGAREAGFDEGALAALTAAIRRGGAYPNIHAVLIVRDGRLVYEEYFAGEDERRGRRLGHVEFTQATLHDIRSVSKAFVGALVGIAIDQGLIASVDQPLLTFFPEHADLATPDLLQITLRHALTMSSGLRWDEATFPYTDERNDETGMDRSDDPVRYVLSRPLVAERGTTWNYSGGLTHVLAAIVQRASGRPLLEYAREVLFEPLGIRDVEWVGRLGDLPSAASGVRLRPRDLAKFGSLYLNEGRWLGRQVVPAQWVRESTARHVAIDSTGAEYYGYQQWFLNRHDMGGRSVEVFSAEGNGGQRIYILPELRMLVTINAGNYNNRETRLVPEQLLLDGILPAVAQLRQ